jgi:hypothetical protein
MIDMLLWISLVIAIVASVIAWLSNLEIASDTNKPANGIVWVRLTWGAFIALSMLKLMMMGTR